MRFSDIKVGYIYNVIFDPVRDCEFDGKHLAVVLKRNNDKATFIVMPLTSAPKFLGLREMVYSIQQEERIEILKFVYEAELISKAKDIAYQIVKLRKDENPNKEKIDELLVQISETIKDML